MTPYEIWSLATAIVAIVISVAVPVGQGLYGRFRKATVKALLFDGFPLTLCFNESGSYAELKLSILSEHAACIVKTLELTIRGSHTDRVFSHGWTFLKPIHANWMSAGFQQAILSSATYVHPIKIEKDKLEPLYVEFGTDPDEKWVSLMRRRDEVMKEVNADDVFNDGLLGNESVSAIVQEISDVCFWAEGRYEIELRILYDAKGEKVQRFTFDLGKAEAEVLRQNALGIVTHCATIQPVLIPVEAA